MNSSKNGIIGLAIGDAMGVPIEFSTREKLQNNPIKEMIGYGIYPVPKGSWSDDTSMTIATIDSIIETKRIDIYNIASKFVEWKKYAKYTPSGNVFDIGGTTRYAISKCEVNILNAVNSGGNTERDNGNGSLMRILPIAYFCYANKYDDDTILETVRIVSSITHSHEISIMGCYIYVKYAIELLNGINKFEAYKKIQNLDYTMFEEDTQNRYRRLLKNDIDTLNIIDIKSSGYVVDTLEATLWTLLNTSSYNSAIIKAINLGSDTDTVGACTGGLAGILYGIEETNKDWKRDLIKYSYIENLCENFDRYLNEVIV